jgi:hypothetical protein
MFLSNTNGVCHSREKYVTLFFFKHVSSRCNARAFLPVNYLYEQKQLITSSTPSQNTSPYRIQICPKILDHLTSQCTVIFSQYIFFLFQYISVSISVLNGRSLLQDLVHTKELFFQMGIQTSKSQVSQIFSSNKNIET